MPQRSSWMGRILDGTNLMLLLLISLITLVPFIYVLAGSLAPNEQIASNEFFLIPKRLTLDAYRYMFSTSTILRSLWVTVGVTVAGTLFNLLMTSLMAYPLARKDFAARKPIMIMVIFTMLFSGGLIPTFIVVRSLGLLDTYAALVIPGAISAFNLIILKNFFQQLPDGIEEAAKIDGCHDAAILWRIVLPLSTPALATFALFYAVGNWNNYFSAILYINDYAKYPIQVLLRQIVILASGGIGDSSQFSGEFVVPSASVKMAVIVIGTLPILLVYPFLQKHFTKGILLGSVKG